MMCICLASDMDKTGVVLATWAFLRRVTGWHVYPVPDTRFMCFSFLPSMGHDTGRVAQGRGGGRGARDKC